MAMDKVAMNDDLLDEVTGGSILPYSVQPGDSLGAIAKKYNVTVEQLVKWNNIQDPNILTVGQQLKVKF
ncbi:MAG: LysM peptidoglycan-binding domain-containing protein [Oscillospiraceae bacterium]|nr:LysM peptidoglycan-binding domain-containing protein [Oscillospiraceae bacterium]